MQSPHVLSPQALLWEKKPCPQERQTSIARRLLRLGRFEVGFHRACLVADKLHRCGQLFLGDSELLCPVPNLIVFAEADTRSVLVACLGLVVRHTFPRDAWHGATVESWWSLGKESTGQDPVHLQAAAYMSVS